MLIEVILILYYRLSEMSSYLYFIQYNTDVLVGRAVNATAVDELVTSPYSLGFALIIYLIGLTVKNPSTRDKFKPLSPDE